MRFLITPDSYKESLSALEAAQVIEKAIHNIMPDAECELAPMADGGEGTAECLMHAENGKQIMCRVKDPLGEEIDADFVWIEEQKKAIVEVAKACGMMLIPQEKRNPLNASTYGVGQLMLKALEMGCRKLVLALGGTATNDGGIGMLKALGAQISDSSGREVPEGGKGLIQIDRIVLDKPCLLLKNVEITVLCDVKSPLLGECGATYVFGTQKGASAQVLDELEQGMKNYARAINAACGREIDKLKGAGAAGGLGCALYAVCNACYTSGSQYVMNALNLEQKIKECDYVITGEGSLDAQSLEGKVPVGIARIAKKYKKPVIAFVGASQGENQALYEKGISAVFCILRRIDTMQNVLEHAQSNLQYTVENFARVLLMNSQ